VILKERYAEDLNRITEWTAAIEGYNNRMDQEIGRRFGRDAMHKAATEAQEQHMARQQASKPAN
jgi:hypothetical protein